MLIAEREDLQMAIDPVSVYEFNMKAYLEPDFLHDLQEKPFDALSAVNVARLPEQIRSITPFTPTDKEMLWRLQQQVQRQGELSLVNVEKPCSQKAMACQRLRCYWWSWLYMFGLLVNDESNRLLGYIPRGRFGRKVGTL